MINLYPTGSSEQVAKEKERKKNKATKMNRNKLKRYSKECIPTRCLEGVVSRMYANCTDSETLPVNQMIEPNSGKYRKGKPLFILLCTRLLYGTWYR